MRQIVVAEGSAILNLLNLSCINTLVIYWKLFVQNNPIRLAVIFAMLSWVFISMNDTVIKLLSDTYPLHQMVFIRSIIGIFFSLFLVKLEGGWQILKTKKPFLHLIRGLLLVTVNMSYFSALVILPLANTAAIFFITPLLITTSPNSLGVSIGSIRRRAFKIRTIVTNNGIYFVRCSATVTLLIPGPCGLHDLHHKRYLTSPYQRSLCLNQATGFYQKFSSAGVLDRIIALFCLRFLCSTIFNPRYPGHLLGSYF